MYVPRTFIIAGIALIAIALGASGHGLWWLIGFVWLVGCRRDAWHACGAGYQHRNRHQGVGYDTTRPDRVPADDVPAGAPDPSLDRHDAFPSGR